MLASLSRPRLLGIGVTALIVFLVVDLTWLGVVATDVYAAQLGDLRAPRATAWAALLFYLLYVVGVVHFAVLPALARQSWRVAAGKGALLGLVAYGTWDLTNLAVIRDFPAPLAFLDLAWGTLLTCVVATATTLVWLRRRQEES